MKRIPDSSMRTKARRQNHASFALSWERVRLSIRLLYVTKLHELGGVNNTNFSTVWRLDIKASAGLVTPMASLLGLWVVTFSLCLHMAFSGVSLHVPTFLHKDIRQDRFRHMLMASF